MDSLVANMPKIWKMEDKVVGADLGKGIFQFNFESEEDLQSVLQNVPYHFDGWMISLVRWEPIIAPTYPSAINFWVKVSDLPMHLWVEATLKAIGKQVGMIRDLDVDSGSVYVTVNGFNPLVFQMVVPFDTGDEVVVSLDYEKLAKFCQHCSRLTHEMSVCPELQKKSGSRVSEDYGDKRGGSRQQHIAKQGSQGVEGGWEKPRKPAAKRTLEFTGEEASGGFRYQMESGDNSKHALKRFDRNQGSSWGQKRSFPGTWAESSESFGREVTKEGFKDSQNSSQGIGYVRKGAGPVWPKPLYQPKTDSKVVQVFETNAQLPKEPEICDKQNDMVMEDVPEMQGKNPSVGLHFSESTDDLLEDGECHVSEDFDTNAADEEIVDDGKKEISTEEKSALKGDVNKQKAAGKSKPKEGEKTDGANRLSKKGMVALLKPPANT